MLKDEVLKASVSGTIKIQTDIQGEKKPALRRHQLGQKGKISVSAFADSRTIQCSGPIDSDECGNSET